MAKIETFADYLRRVGADHRAANRPATALDYQIAGAVIDYLHDRARLSKHITLERAEDILDNTERDEIRWNEVDKKGGFR
jgi:hypothetical protein